MQTIESRLAGVEGTFGDVRDLLAPDGFSLANNWEYYAGFFDRKLDEEGMVFLRLPFDVIQGKLDTADARIRFGTPFVLKHVYQTGVEEHIGYTSGPLVAPVVNQFQEPVDKDAPLERHWVQQAEAIVRQLEKRWA
ncbi:hypothetical protein G3578_15910 [Brevibacillus sp. SYP-B805]|uniref:YugN family protein n=1 Tax=Brevibacillus sp. SYP-B805 TaxID=1578199 RepID=UPI0013EB2DE7|nr:YugN family protein [Brevibacillus sp. SYP-B805]NGQ96649.1 hypothetical protein [Brevibacillus sp. SYP-B805]